jgi:hypothetical protein
VSLTFAHEPEGLFAIEVKGILTFEELTEFQNNARVEIDRGKKVKVLAIFTEFTGWGTEGDWGDLTFMYEAEPYIEKIAVVTTAKWKDEILMFLGAGRRQTPVKHFFEDNAQDARDWLATESE